MAESMTAVVDTSTNEFLSAGQPSLDPRYVVVGPLPRNPNPAIEKYSGIPADPFVAKTAPEMAATLTAQQTDRATATSRQKDILATIAWAVRAKNVAAWNAQTLAQKKSTVLAEADNWRDIRVFIEQNL